MTAVAAPVQVPAPTRELPGGGLFHSPIGLYGFQADDVAKAYLMTEPGSLGGAAVIWDMGIGKTVLSLCLAAYLFEDDKIDLVILACEQPKVRDWCSDIERFTSLTSVRYHDAGRHKRLAKAGPPHVLVTTHETGRTDLMKRVSTGSRGKGRATDGPLFDALGLRDKRILWVFDEPKMRSRGSAIYSSYDYALNQLRRGPHHQRVIALTGTPYETSTSDAFNLGRFVAPKGFPGVGEFEKKYTNGRDQFGNLTFSYSNTLLFGQHHFQQICIRRRKTDPEVVDQFPKLIEKSRKVPLVGDHKRFYETIEKIFDPPAGTEDDRTEDQVIADGAKLAMPLRLSAGHPAAHLHVDNDISRSIVEHIGEQGLRAIGSCKTAALIAELKPLIKGQGAQVLLFEFYTSIIIEVARELRAAGYTVGEFHGRNSDAQNEEAKRAFLAGEIEIFFASDKAARGLNLQNAEYTYEYSPAFTYAVHGQRGNRANRIDSTKPSTTFVTMALEDSVDVDTLANMISRNKDQDHLLGDAEAAEGTSFITADERRRMLAAHRRRRG